MYIYGRLFKVGTHFYQCEAYKRKVNPNYEWYIKITNNKKGAYDAFGGQHKIVH